MSARAPRLGSRHALARLVAFAGLLAACGGQTHIRKTPPKVRDYKADSYAKVEDRRAEGSLWNESADTLFTYRRATSVGDLITIVIKETAAATRDAATDLSRSSSIDFGIGGLFGLLKEVQKAYPSLDPDKLISALSKSEFKGQGQTSRSGTVHATLTARIKRVMPNGDLYVEGTKVVLINDEESYLYLSGVVRPADVEADNSVDSAKIADAEVEYTGRGSVADQQRQGWLSRFWSRISPF